MADRRAETIGFIGLGLMGHGMAKNIVEKGYKLTVLGHRNRKPIEDLVGRGAIEAEERERSGRPLDNRVSMRDRVAGSRGDRARRRGPEGGPPQGFRRRRLLDLRSEFDARARRRIRGRSASTMSTRR